MLGRKVEFKSNVKWDGLATCHSWKETSYSPQYEPLSKRPRQEEPLRVEDEAAVEESLA